MGRTGSAIGWHWWIGWSIEFAPLARACSPESTRCVVLKDSSELQDTQFARPWWGWVKVESSDATDATPEALAAACPNLVVLILAGCYEVGDPGIASVASKCKGIVILDLEDSGVGDAGLRSLADGCPHLTRLTLSGCRVGTESLCPLVTVTTLKLCGATVDDRWMKNLPTPLTDLDLMDCVNITDQGLVDLAARCPHLVRLCLAGCERVTDKGLASLAVGCPALIYVDLRNCPNCSAPWPHRRIASCE